VEKEHKRIWDLQHTTVCKIVGLALDFDHLRKIGRKFHIIPKNDDIDREFALHASIVGMCGKENPVARHVQKTLEKRFAPYVKSLSQKDMNEIGDLIVGGREQSGVPLWAILWELAVTRFSQDERVEAMLFGYIHMLEHKLLKEFWTRPEGRQELEDRQRLEITELRRDLLELKSERTKLERSNEKLKNSIILNNPSPGSDVGRVGDTAARDKIGRLKGLLEESREKSRRLEEQCARFQSRAEALTREFVLRESKDSTEVEQSMRPTCSFSAACRLEGKRIAMVGGIDGLESHYKQCVEQWGGEFCRHDGRCCRGGRKLEECIRNADLVVCPISVNSHFGAKGVKSVCRKHGIKCCFPDSAGLESFRGTLVRHFAPEEPVSEDCCIGRSA
jgi:hypothetical protein